MYFIFDKFSTNFSQHEKKIPCLNTWINIENCQQYHRHSFPALYLHHQSCHPRPGVPGHPVQIVVLTVLEKPPCPHHEHAKGRRLVCHVHVLTWIFGKGDSPMQVPRNRTEVKVRHDHNFELTRENSIIQRIGYILFKT